MYLSKTVAFLFAQRHLLTGASQTRFAQTELRTCNYARANGEMLPMFS